MKYGRLLAAAIAVMILFLLGTMEVSAVPPDKDGDGVPDAVDACPNDPDNDKDGDGQCGDVDPFPNDPGATEIQQFELKALEGTIDPVTYTDGDGTFTSSEITVTLNSLNPSTMSIETSIAALTSFISGRLFLDVSFNNGKPGPLSEDLMGTIALEESGPLLPPSDPFCQQFPQPITGCAEPIINSGILTGAGPFNLTTVKGNAPTSFDSVIECPIGPIRFIINIITLRWDFSAPGSPPHILIDLPSPPFIGGEDIVVHGEMTGCMVPISAVGGIVERPDIDDLTLEPAGSSDGSSPLAYAGIAVGVAVAALALAAGGWHARRRWLR